jgi:coenzyme Q-binding protein COQ10
MLVLVTDVEAYPEFINFVSAVRVLDRKTLSGSAEQFTADIGVQYKFVSERFRSIVSIDRETNILEIGRAGHGGAVRELSNKWSFIELSDGSTLIDFKLSVRMKAAPLEFLIRQKFEKAVNHIVDVFEIRAGQVHPTIGEKDYDFSAERASIS